MESLGYYIDGSGYYRDKTENKPLTIKLLYNKNEKPEIIANVVDYFDELGIKIDKISAKGITIRQILNTQSDEKWDLYYLSEKMQSNQFIRSYYHSGEMNSNNWGGYRNKNIDLLLDRFQASDGTEKSQLGPQIHQALYDDVAVIGLFVNPTWAIYHKHVRPFIVPWYYFDQPHQWTTNK